MESEVSALIGATDEEHWERAGLFASVDELCRSNDKSHLHNGGINVPFTPSVEFPVSPNFSTKPFHFPGRVTDSQNYRVSVSQPRGDSVGLNFECGVQVKGAQVE